MLKESDYRALYFFSISKQFSICPIMKIKKQSEDELIPAQELSKEIRMIRDKLVECWMIANGIEHE